MVLIFDFDGTIADTFDLYIEVMRDIHQEYKFKYILDEDIERYRGMGAKEILKDLGISLIRVSSIAHRVRKEFKAKIRQQKLFPELGDVLKKLQQDGYQLFILSSNSKENIEVFLECNNAHYFDDVISKSNIFGKARSIKKVINERQFNPDEVLYIGDEVRDIEATKKANIKIVAVSWGYNNKKVLQQQNPEFLIDSPTDIYTVL